MSRSTLDVTSLSLDVSGNPVSLASSLNNLDLEGSGGSNVSLTGVENISVHGSAIFTETGGDTTETVTIAAPVTVTSNYSLLLPGTQGTSDTILSNDGSGNLSWSNPSTIYSITTVNAATYTALSTDHFINVNYTTTGACTITLPEIATVGKIVYEITDTGGNANEFNITINVNAADTVIGDTSVIISENYNSVTLANDGANKWLVI